MSAQASEYSEKGKSNDVFADFDPEVRVRTKKMLMYFIIFAIVMLFAGFTSAYIVSSMGEYWVHIKAPAMLWVSNGIIIVSSLTIWLSLRAMKQGKKQLSMMMLVATFILGIAFTLTQMSGWGSLAEKGMGWSITETAQGMQAYKWNNLDRIEGTYGVDYYVGKDGKQLIFDNGEFYAADDVLKAEPITRDVLKQSNVAAEYLWILIVVHILHLAFGLIYLVVNIIRSAKGIIHEGDTIRLYTNGMYWHFLGILWLYLFVFLFLIH